MARDFEFEKGKDYYLENGCIVLTDRYLKKRKFCCGGGCRHCPYTPQHTKGSTDLIIKEK
tara:strand:- start:22790 stop:22969 length:180 start_codon:yes stop_codon:yes gene_type:complete